jgi:phytoene desaturase
MAVEGRGGLRTCGSRRVPADSWRTPGGCGISNGRLHRPQLRRPRDLLNARTWRGCWSRARSAACRAASTASSGTKRRRGRIFSFQAMYAGLAPHKALALYAVIAYLDSVAGVYYPIGGMHAVPLALANAAQKHGVEIHYDTEVTRVESARAGPSRDTLPHGRSFPCDVRWCSTRTPRAAHRMLPTGPPRRRLVYSPSCVVAPRRLDARLSSGRPSQRPLWTDLAPDLRRGDRTGRADERPVVARHQPDENRSDVAPAGSRRTTFWRPFPTCGPGPSTGAGIWPSDTPTNWSAYWRDAGYPGFARRSGRTCGRHACRLARRRDGGRHAVRRRAHADPDRTVPIAEPAPRAGDNVVFSRACGTTPASEYSMVLISGKLAAARVTGGSGR